MKWWASLPVLALAVTISAARADTVLLSDNFNAENGGVGVLNYNGFANWDVTRQSVDLIGNGFFDFYPGNGLYVDLDGSTFSAGKMETKTTFSLTPGTYTLMFDLGGSQRGDTNTVHVSLGSVYAEDFTLMSSDPLSTVVRTINVGSADSGKLIFDHDGGDDLGLILDNVSLVRKDMSVPEPSTVAFALAMLPLGASALRRRSNKARK